MRLLFGLIFIAAATLLTSGCALQPAIVGNTPFTASLGERKSEVKWVVVSDVRAYCKGKLRVYEPTGMQVMACSQWSNSNDTCTIYTSTEPSYELLGHEFRHCFDKNYH